MPLDHTLAYKTKCQRLAEQERTGSTLTVEPERAAPPPIEPVTTEPNNHGVFRVYSAVPM